MNKTIFLLFFLIFNLINSIATAQEGVKGNQILNRMEKFRYDRQVDALMNEGFYETEIYNSSPIFEVIDVITIQFPNLPVRLPYLGLSKEYTMEEARQELGKILHNAKFNCRLTCVQKDIAYGQCIFSREEEGITKRYDLSNYLLNKRIVGVNRTINYPCQNIRPRPGPDQSSDYPAIPLPKFTD